MIDPGGVGGEELGGPRREPGGQPVVVLLRGGDLPAHEQEHDVEEGDFFGERGEIGKGGEDVGEYFGEGVRVDAAGGVKEGGDAGVEGPDKLGDRDAVGGKLLAFVEEVEEETV